MKRLLLITLLVALSGSIGALRWRTDRRVAELTDQWEARASEILESGADLATDRFTRLEREAISRLQASAGSPKIRDALGKGDDQALLSAVAARPPARYPEGFSLYAAEDGRCLAWSGAPHHSLIPKELPDQLDSRVVRGPDGPVLLVTLPVTASGRRWRLHLFHPLTAGLLGQHPATDFDGNLGRQFGRPIRVFGTAELTDVGLKRALRSSTGRVVGQITVQEASLEAEQQRIRLAAGMPGLVLAALLLLVSAGWAGQSLTASRLGGPLRCGLLCGLIAAVLLLALQVDLTALMPDEPIVAPTFYGDSQLGPVGRSPITLLLSLVAVLCVTLTLRTQPPPTEPLGGWSARGVARGVLSSIGVVLAVWFFVCATGNIVSNSTQVRFFPQDRVMPELPALLLQGGLLICALTTLMLSEWLLAWGRATLGGALGEPVAWSATLLLALLGVAIGGGLGLWPGKLDLPVFGVALAWFTALLLVMLREYRWIARVLVLLLATGALAYPTLSRAIYQELLAEARYEAETFDWEAEAGRRVAHTGKLEFAADRMVEQLEQLMVGRSKPPADLAFRLWRTSELTDSRLHCHIRVLGAKDVLLGQFKLNMPPWSWYRAELLTIEKSPWATTSPQLIRMRRDRYDLELFSAVRELGLPDGQRLLLSLTLPFLGDRFRPRQRVPGMFGLTEQEPPARLFYVLWDAQGRVRSSLGREAMGLPRPEKTGVLTLHVGDREGRMVVLAGKEGSVHQGKRVAIGTLHPDSATTFLDYVRLLLTFILLSLLGLPLILVWHLLGRLPAQALLGTERRIIVAFVALSFLPLLWLAGLSHGRARAWLDQSTRHDLSASLASLRNVIGERTASGELDPRLLDTAWCRQISDDLGRIFFIYSKGRLLAASHPELRQIGLVAERPSIRAAETLLHGQQTTHVGRLALGSRTVAMGYAPLLDRSGKAVGLVATPALAEHRRLQETLARSTLLLVAVYGLVLLLVVLAGLLLARWISRPVEKLLEGTRQVAAGNLDHRIEYASRDEFGELVDSFNKMTHDLQIATEQALDEERAEAFSTMARQIAHEIKNPLTPMKLSTQHLRDAFDRQHPKLPEIVEKSTRTLIEQIEALTRIATEFSAFAKFPRRKFEVLPLEPLLEEVCQMYDEYEGRITIARRLSGEPSRVRVDRDELRRIFINLFTNSIQAIPDEGRIVVLTERAHLAPIEESSFGGSSRAFVETKLVDDGPGIPEEILTKIFRPNFSTKSAGTGLGLAICKKSITELGGEIRIKSTLGEGTTVSILLPIHEVGEAPAGPEA